MPESGEVDHWLTFALLTKDECLGMRRRWMSQASGDRFGTGGSLLRVGCLWLLEEPAFYSYIVELERNDPRPRELLPRLT